MKKQQNTSKKKPVLDSNNKMLWIRFRRRVTSDAKAIDLVYKELTKAQLVKCQCGCTTFTHKPSARTCKCRECGNEIWFTSLAFFRKARLVRAYLAAIWFYQNNTMISGAEFSRLLRICSSSSWEILKKVKLAMITILPENASVAPHKALIEIILKRSLETEKYEHPSSDLPLATETDDENSESAEDEREPEFTQSDKPDDLSENESLLYDNLTDEPTLIDNLVAKCQMTTGTLLGIITELEIRGLVSSFPGERYARARGKSADQKPKQKQALGLSEQRRANKNYVSAMTVAPLIILIRRVHHGFSRKYLQLELAAFWSIFAKNFWIKNSLLMACLRHPPVTRNDVLAYSSPLEVKVPTA